MTKQELKKAIILARVSDPIQLEGQSIPAQIARSREYALKRSLDVYKEFEFDESSTKDYRVKFEQVVEEIKKSKECIALIVETVDRLQRSFRESVMLDEYRKSGLLEIHFLRENLIIHQNSNSSEIQRWDLAVLVAKSYVLQISDNIKRTFEHRIQNGEIIRIAPIGYLNVDKKTNNGIDVILNPANAHLVKKIFELYATGLYSMKTVADMVSEMGLRNARARKPLTVRNIEEILKNPFYYGMQRYKGGLHPHKYEPLISYELFKQCERIRLRYKQQPTKHAATSYAFKGLITCARCGCAITPETKKGKYTYYHCTNFKRICDKVWVREEELIKPIKAVFDKLKLPQKTIEEVTEALRKTEQSKNEFHSHQMSTLKSEYDRLENRISVMYEDRLDGRITAEDYDSRLKKFKEQQNDVLFKMRQYDKADETFYVTANQVLSLAQRASEVFERSEAHEKKQLVNFVFQNLSLDGKNLQYKLKTPFDTVFSVQASNVWSG